VMALRAFAARHGQALRSTRRRTLLLWFGLAAACVVLSLAGHRLVLGVEAALDLPAADMRAAIDSRVFLALLLLYVLLLACPFVPGAELGILILIVFGPEAAIAVYGSTVLALTLAFLVGRLVPLPRLVAWLRRAGLSRAAEVLASGSSPALRALDAPPVPARTGGLLARILRHRCCALGILFNTPGNSLIGGGGGIAIATGASRLLGFPHFLATVVIAVAPVPAAIQIADWLT
jgi:hypothetical protein